MRDTVSDFGDIWRALSDAGIDIIRANNAVDGIKTLAARLAEAKRDAERYRFLQQWMLSLGPDGGKLILYRDWKDSREVHRIWMDANGMNLDIDAARADDSAPLDMVPAPDGSRVLCVADSEDKSHE